MRPCKRCQTKTALTQEDIDKMVSQVVNMRGIRLVDDAVYAERMRVCETCGKFEYSSTCVLCGCVMQVRARLNDGTCPYPKGKKW